MQQATMQDRSVNVGFADQTAMQHMLFAELSSMFGKEVPLYDKSLLVNRQCNRVVCELLGKLHVGFSITDEQLEKTSGERHGAIRIGKRDEYRWIARFFNQFAMQPHNFYDMTSVGAKSQPVIATAFRAVDGPEHRIFTSLLMTDYFDGPTQGRIEGLLAGRTVFSDAAKGLIEKAERQGGLNWDDARALIREGTERIFKWTGKARDFALYTELCDGGFKIAADIACFERHHLNHLTPNTLCMDLYTAAMKFCLGQMDEGKFRMRVELALGRMAKVGGDDYMRLSFRHLSHEQIVSFGKGKVSEAQVGELVDWLVKRLSEADLVLKNLPHNGFKDFTEGPSEDTPLLLRQDAYKALTENVTFANSDGTVVQAKHTARFGEIEQRFYAATPKGREMYDKALGVADAAREKDPKMPERDFAGYERMYAEPFKVFPKTAGEMIEQGLIHARYFATAKGLAAKGSIRTKDVRELLKLGYVRAEGLRYEDFLPVSAAGIFASNLSQYGTKSTAAVKPEYTRAMLEEIMGKGIIDAAESYAKMEEASIEGALRALGVG